MQKLVMLLAMWLTTTGVFAQYTLKGKVIDDATGESITGANVFIASLNQGDGTNDEGEFQLQEISEGTYLIEVSMVGYTTFRKRVEVKDDLVIDFRLKSDLIRLEEIIVMGTRANENTPTTFTELSKDDIADQNLGQDLPFLLNWTPSVVVTSDAGAGIGYTGLRIRGSDASRINVTINGIPVNDSESQGVFWVNMPDLATSTDNIQVQRGVGTSTNGAGAFGGSINILTSGLSQEPEASINTTFGSFNTQKFNAVYKTGLLNDRFAFEGRLSQISSDGFIDRASSDLNSYYLSAGYYGKKSILKFITFAGKERTYQSWYGTPEAKLRNDEAGIEAVIANNGFTPEQADNLRNAGRTYNFYQYENQVDDYGQDNYQLHYSQDLATSWSLNSSLHYTKGAGFFEEFKNDQDFEDYALPNVNVGGTTISSTDLIRRRWLDNDFYGITYGLNYDSEKVQFNVGGAYNEYIGDHFGEIIWAQFASTADFGERFYESESKKSDFNMFSKLNYQLNDRLNLYGDLQFRSVAYSGLGNDNDLRAIDFDEQYNFFNPKVGATYTLNSAASLYSSFSVGNKEPNRSDIIDARGFREPVAETLNNLEMGYRLIKTNFALEVNYYLMDYRNQLVLTGELNDVGSGIRTNVPDSYRTGIEIQLAGRLAKGLSFNGNISLSENKIRRFSQVLYDYGADFSEFNEVVSEFEDTNIAFSPSVVAGGQLSYEVSTDFSVTLLSKYVGEQFLDNTSNQDRKIDAFFVNDLRLNHTFHPKFMQELNLSLLVNNIFDIEYESNGYTFGYFGGGNEVRENYLYPQAGTHFLLSLGLRF
ncbi:MAG: iron complex outermembrane receptor protein [Candidatus Endobugula sp.]|jgi:iron complex outermembrane receptor protein